MEIYLIRGSLNNIYFASRFRGSGNLFNSSLFSIDDVPETSKIKFTLTLHYIKISSILVPVVQYTGKNIDQISLCTFLQQTQKIYWNNTMGP